MTVTAAPASASRQASPRGIRALMVAATASAPLSLYLKGPPCPRMFSSEKFFRRRT
jgi:hypothetical protein